MSRLRVPCNEFGSKVGQRLERSNSTRLIVSCAQIQDPSYAFKRFTTLAPLRIRRIWPSDYEINFEAVLRAARSAVECDDYQGRGAGIEIGEE